MRHARPFPWLAAVALAAAAGLAGPAAAQREKVVVTRADVGLPPGRFVSERTDSQKPAPVFKAQSWAPVYLDLELKAKIPGPLAVRVDTTDDDDLKTTLTVPLGNFSDRNPGEIVRADELPFIPYARPGDDTGGSVTLTVVGEDGSAVAEPVQVRYLRGRPRSTYVVLSLGSNLPGFDLPDPKKPADGQQDPAGGRRSLRNGRVETAAITTVRQMPDRWIGYDSVDLCVIGTGAANDEFLRELFSDGPANEARRTALLEWVRRGGRLLVTVGANAPLLSQYPVFNELLPRPLVRDEPGRQVPELTLVWRPAGRTDQRSQVRGKAGNPIPIARFDDAADAPGRVLLRNTKVGRDADDTEYPLVAQKAYGLGRVTVAGIDLDRSPFLDLEPDVRASFWDWLVRQSGDDRSAAGSPERQTEFSYNSDTEDGFAAALKVHVDDFQDVPVISFGWVALFIALYTLLIGPVEYLFLKKVVGRLELTWVTFPLIVLSVSAAAYFTAYAIKGDDLRINKVDVVDVDPASGRVYGRSWFTIFSPRIDSYTIGLTPRPEWAGGRPGAATPPTRVDWMAGGRVGGGNIVSRGYGYHTDAAAREYADGLEGVPIQVWSTKAFAADWSAWVPADAPLIESQLYHPPGDPTAVTGKIVNNLPLGQLDDAYLAYGGNFYKLGSLAPGVSVTPVLGRETIATEWLQSNAALSGIGADDAASYNGYNANSGVRFRSLSLWGMLFYERAAAAQGKADPQNASFRPLDQSWRLSEDVRDQAILVARVATAHGPSEDLMTRADGPSPTTLWLRELPSGGRERTPVKGTLRQETYVRVYLPVAGR